MKPRLNWLNIIFAAMKKETLLITGASSNFLGKGQVPKLLTKQQKMLKEIFRIGLK